MPHGNVPSSPPPMLPTETVTVRNHVSNLFDKLGVWTRAQAMVFAHDHGFGRS